MPTCKLTKKNSFTHRPSDVFCLFSQNTSRFLLPKRLWKCVSTISFSSVTYCNLPVQLRFIHLTFSWVQFFGILCFLQYIKSQEHLSFCSVFLSHVLFYKNLIVLHHGVCNFLFYFDICIKFTLSTNLNDEEMITSHLMCYETTFLW